VDPGGLGGGVRANKGEGDRGEGGAVEG
jgi:hypothetical protein